MVPFKAILVEGTSGAGKSTFIDGAIRQHVTASAPRKIRTLVHLAQSHTYGPVAVPEDRGTLTVEENLRHLEDILKNIEWLHAGAREHTSPWCFLIVDTLHLTHCVRPRVVRWSDVAALDGRLAALGCKLLFLEVSPVTIWERGIKPRLHEQFIQQYARKFGRSHEEIHEYFVREQEIMGKMFAQSSMPKMLLKNDESSKGTIDAAYKFWLEDLS